MYHNQESGQLTRHAFTSGTITTQTYKPQPNTMSKQNAHVEQICPNM